VHPLAMRPKQQSPKDMGPGPVPGPLVDLGQFDSAVALILDIARNHDIMSAQIGVRAVLEELLSSCEEAACTQAQACRKHLEQRRRVADGLRQRRVALLHEEASTQHDAEHEMARQRKERELEAKARDLEARERRLNEFELTLEIATKRIDERREALLNRDMLQSFGAVRGEAACEGDADVSTTGRLLAASEAKSRGRTRPQSTDAAATPLAGPAAALAADAAGRSQPPRPDRKTPPQRNAGLDMRRTQSDVVDSCTYPSETGDLLAGPTDVEPQAHGRSRSAGIKNTFARWVTAFGAPFEG